MCDGVLRKEGGKPFDISEDEIWKIWNGEQLRAIRKKMLRGEVVRECIKCKVEEETYQSSERYNRCAFFSEEDFEQVEYARQNDGFVTRLPSMLDLKIGNICNLKCRMCQPLDSVLVDREFYEISQKYPSFRHYPNANAFDYYYPSKPFSEINVWADSEIAQNNLRLLTPFLQHVSLAGGETIITPAVGRFLEMCRACGRASEMTLSISSNLTHVPPRFVELLRFFKHVQLTSSIDGIGKVQEYIRYPSKWDVVRSNFEYFVEAEKNITPVILPTVQIYNVLDIVDLLRFPEQYSANKWNGVPPFHMTLLFFPHFLNIRYLPTQVKNVALERVKRFQKESYYCAKSKRFNDQVNLLVATLASPDFTCDERQLGYFLKYTEILDEFRAQKFSDSLPELYELLCKQPIKPLFPAENEQSFSFHCFVRRAEEYRDAGQRLDAIRMYQQALNLDRNNQHLLYSLAVLYWDSGLFSEVEGILTQITPDFEKYQDVLLMKERLEQDVKGEQS